MSSKVIKWFKRQASIRRHSDKSDDKSSSPQNSSEEKKRSGFPRLSFRKRNKKKAGSTSELEGTLAIVGISKKFSHSVPQEMQSGTKETPAKLPTSLSLDSSSLATNSPSKTEGCRSPSELSSHSSFDYSKETNESLSLGEREQPTIPELSEPNEREESPELSKKKEGDQPQTFHSLTSSLNSIRKDRPAANNDPNNTNSDGRLYENAPIVRMEEICDIIIDKEHPEEAESDANDSIKLIGEAVRPETGATVDDEVNSVDTDTNLGSRKLSEEVLFIKEEEDENIFEPVSFKGGFSPSEIETANDVEKFDAFREIDRLVRDASLLMEEVSDQPNSVSEEENMEGENEKSAEGHKCEINTNLKQSDFDGDYEEILNTDASQINEDSFNVCDNLMQEPLINTCSGLTDEVSDKQDFFISENEDTIENGNEDKEETDNDDKSETHNEARSETHNDDKSETHNDDKSETHNDDKSETHNDKSKTHNEDRRSETHNDDKSETHNEDRRSETPPDALITNNENIKIIETISETKPVVNDNNFNFDLRPETNISKEPFTRPQREEESPVKIVVTKPSPIKRDSNDVLSKATSKTSLNQYPKDLNPFGDEDESTSDENNECREDIPSPRYDGTNTNVIPKRENGVDRFKENDVNSLEGETNVKYIQHKSKFVNRSSPSSRQPDTKPYASSTGSSPRSLNPFGDSEEEDDDQPPLRPSPTRRRSTPDPPPTLPPKSVDLQARKNSRGSLAAPIPRPRRSKQSHHGSCSSLQGVPACPVPLPRSFTPSFGSTRTLNGTTNPFGEDFEDDDEGENFLRGAGGRCSVQVGGAAAFPRSEVVRGSLPPSSRTKGRKKRQAPLPPGLLHNKPPRQSPSDRMFTSLPRKRSSTSPASEFGGSFVPPRMPPPRPPPPKI